MPRIFNRERFGTPQFVAGLLLLCFLTQCLWLSHVHPMNEGELLRIQQGLAQLEHRQFAVNDADRSPLYYVFSAAPLLPYSGATASSEINKWRLVARLPWLLVGLLLGASLWYVARRLYGNVGGYIALVLYGFSPVMISQASAYDPQPEMPALWGSFGVVFTAIAVSHTLYAPRKVLWNWKRIMLLALSLVLAIGTQFSLVFLAVVALGFLIYLAPGRRGAAVAIFAASCVIAFVILLASYGFSPSSFVEQMKHARFWPEAAEALGLSFVYVSLAQRIVRTSPALLAFLPMTVITYIAWPRARYFGNTAPLLVAMLLFFLSLMTPHQPGTAMQLAAMPVLFVFISGVLADLAETRYRQLVLGLAAGLLGAHVIWSISGLLRLG